LEAKERKTMSENQVYRDLPEAVVTEVGRLNKSASNLTIGMVISLFFPAVFLFVFAFAIVRILESKALLKRHPELSHPHLLFPGKTKEEVKTSAESNPNLRKVLEFTQARKGFWVVLFSPFLIAGICVGLYVVLT
jgi:hypothetical protein